MQGVEDLRSTQRLENFPINRGKGGGLMGGPLIYLRNTPFLFDY